jgi:putative ABC transport system permease protein
MALTYDPSRISFLSIRIRPGQSREAIEHVRSVSQAIAPDVPFRYSFVDDDFNKLYRSDEQTAEAIGFFSVLAILVACLGLFGLASFTTERRRKEIGIRIVLGASVSGVIALLTREFVLLVVVSNLVAWPIAYYAMNRWLEDFAYRTDLDATTLLLAGGLALLIALLTVIVQAVKAALVNPATALRYE